MRPVAGRCGAGTPCDRPLSPVEERRRLARLRRRDADPRVVAGAPATAAFDLFGLSLSPLSGFARPSLAPM